MRHEKTELKGNAAEERMLEDAKRFILASGEFRTVSNLAKLLQADSHKLAQQLNAWKNCGEIFSIPGDNESELFPVFALDPRSGRRCLRRFPKSCRSSETSCLDGPLLGGSSLLAATWMTSSLKICLEKTRTG